MCHYCRVCTNPWHAPSSYKDSRTTGYLKLLTLGSTEQFDTYGLELETSTGGIQHHPKDVDTAVTI